MEYECEVELVLLALQSYIRTRAMAGEPATTLVHYVANLFSTAVQHYLINETRIERILRASSTSSEDTVTPSLSDILSAPLEVPVASTFIMSDVSDMESSHR